MEKRIVNIKFRGVDDWNRPIFKDINTNEYYGSTTMLFGYGDDPNSIKSYFQAHIHELEYFGTSFGCEPLGGINPNITLNIVE